MNVGNIDNQSYAMKLLNSTLQTPTTKQLLNTDETQQRLTETLKKSGQTIAISQMGKYINDLYSDLGKTGSKDDVEQAREALRQTVVQFAKTPNNQQLLNFVKATKEYSKTFGTQELQRAFNTSLEASQVGVNISEWWNTFSSINDNSLRKEFVNLTEKINQAEASSSMKQRTVNKLLSTINELNNNLPENNRTQALSDMFAQLEVSQNLEQMNQTMATFKEESLGEEGLI